MKILFYNHTGQVSGAERVLLQIVKGLDREQFDLAVLCPDASRLTEMTRHAGVRTTSIGSLNARFTWRPDLLVKYLASFVTVIREARRAVLNEQPDLIHANSIRAGMVMTAATTGLRVPVVWHAHDILPRHPFTAFIRMLALMPRHNHVIAVSHAVADRFKGALVQSRYSSRVTVIHNSVDLDQFQPDARLREETRAELGFSRSDLLIGTVGQLTPRKGQHQLIDAFARLAEREPSAILLIVGAALFNRDREYAESLEQQVKSLELTDRVRFLGPRDDVPALMRALDLVVVNSQQEPFALTVLEGLSSGTAVLATSVGGIPEMVHHKQNGWLVPAKNCQALAEAIETLLNDPSLRARLGQQGRQDAVNHFSIERFLRQVKSTYHGVIGSGEMPHQFPAKSLKTKLSAD